MQISITAALSPALKPDILCRFFENGVAYHLCPPGSAASKRPDLSQHLFAGAAGLELESNLGALKYTERGDALRTAGAAALKQVRRSGGEQIAWLARLEPLGMTVRQKTLGFLANPNVAALLMLIGTLGIALELYHPGSLAPGIAGGLCLFLAFLAMRVIPVNLGAVLLLIAGVGLMIAEAYVTAHGLAGLSGAVCVVLGTLFFVDASAPGDWFDPSMLSVSPWVVWPTPLALALLLGFMAWKVARSRRRPLELGAPGLVGALGEALSDIDAAAGEAFVHGEYWQARSAGPIGRGARVRVVGVAGLVLTVVAEPGATG